MAPELDMLDRKALAKGQVKATCSLTFLVAAQRQLYMNLEK